MGKRRRFAGWTFVLACTTVVAVHAQRSGEPAGPLTLFAAITDARGAFVNDVRAGDLRVFEGGANAPILKVEPIDWPIKVRVLVDNGLFMTDALYHLRNSLKALMRTLPDGVDISLQTMAPQPRWLVRPTDDRAALLQGIDRLTIDDNASRFVDALRETAVDVAVDKERNVFPVVIVVGTMGPEGSDFRNDELQRMMRDYWERAATVHVVLLSNTAATAASLGGAESSGSYQTEVGLALTKMTGGRYEGITVVSRLSTLLPEIGKQVARSHAAQSRQYRITFERPAGKTGPVGAISMMSPSGWQGRLSHNGRLP